MKQSALRICCAFLLMGIALTVSAGTIGAVFANETEKTPEAELAAAEPLWVRMVLIADKPVGRIRICSADGMPLQTLTPDSEGRALSELMEPGTYLAFTQYGCAEFLLRENASVEVLSGCGWSDGEQLHLTDAQVGTVTIEAPRPETAEGWLDFVLTDGDFRRREVVWFAPDEERVCCTFAGVPFGTYVLEKSGVEQCNVVLTAEMPELSLTLS